MDVSSGVDRGRIWRIAPDGYQADGLPGWARRRRPSWSPCSSTPTAGIATRPRGCCTSGRIGPRSRPCGGWPRDRSRPSAAPHALSSLSGLGRDRAGRRRWPRWATADPHVRAHALRLAEPFCRGGRSDRRAGWRRWSATPTRWSATSSRSRWARCRATRAAAALAALAVRDGVRSLDAAGDPQLGDDLHRRRSSRAWPATPASAPRRTGVPS